MCHLSQLWIFRVDGIFLMYSKSAALSSFWLYEYLQDRKTKDENNLILSVLKISFQIFKVNCFMSYFTSMGKTKLSYRTIAKEVLRTVDSSDFGYMWWTGNTKSQALFQEWAEPLTTLLSRKHPKVKKSVFFLLGAELNRYLNAFIPLLHVLCNSAILCK